MDERVRVGSLAGPLRSLECVASGKSKGVRTANDRMEVQAQRQPSILTKGRRMPRWHVQRGRRQAIIGAVRRIHAVAESLRQVADSAQTVEVKVSHLESAKNGGVCCYSTRSGSAHLPLSPLSEGLPAIHPLPAPDKGAFCLTLPIPAGFFNKCFRHPRGKTS